MNKVCIIGAGISGLACIDKLKLQNIPYVCFEKRSSLGGLWNYDDTERSVYSSCTQNHLRDNMSICSLSPSEKFNQYMYHKEYLEYLNQFDDENIEYNSDVTSIYYEKDTELWVVCVNGKTHSFKHVVICSGYYSEPKCPDFIASPSMKISCIHSSKYKKPTSYENKNVLIIGAGSSSLQIAEDIGRFAKSVSISYRKMPLLLPRYIDGILLWQFYQKNKSIGEEKLIDLIVSYTGQGTGAGREHTLLSFSAIRIRDKNLSRFSLN